MLTAMACKQPLMDLESAYIAALGDVTGYQVTGDQTGLVLTGGTAALTFTPQPAEAALSLEQTDWTLTTIATPASQAVSSTIAGTKVTALFDGDGCGHRWLQHLPRHLRGGWLLADVRPAGLDAEALRAGRVEAGTAIPPRSTRRRPSPSRATN
jgi:hypothetical protein